jgi:hypothetical protein
VNDGLLAKELGSYDVSAACLQVDTIYEIEFMQQEGTREAYFVSPLRSETIRI